MRQMLKTTLLLGLLTGLFMAIGYLVGGRSGALIALALAAMINFAMYWFSDKLVLKMQGAKPLDEHKHSNIVTMVCELTHADNLPMPRLYVMDTPLPNAFATGRNPRHAVVAVTTGIMEILTPAELKAVIGHELGHVKNRDMLISTIAATIAGAVSFIAEMAYWSGALFGGGGEDEDGASNWAGSLAMLILAPIAAGVIQLAVSRSRELLADQHGARLVGDGRALASALQKLEDFKRSIPPLQPTPREQATAHLMFANMFSARGLTELFSTHPSTAKRIALLTGQKRTQGFGLFAR